MVLYLDIFGLSNGVIYDFLKKWSVNLLSRLFFKKKSVKVLVVDDEGKPLTEIQNFAKKSHPDHSHNYEIVIAYSVETARTCLEREQPDYAVIDLNLKHSKEPTFDGIDIIAAIFENEFRTIPIILSRYPFKGEVRKRLKQLLSLGFNDKEKNEQLKQLEGRYIHKTSRSGHPTGYVGVLFEVLEREQRNRKK